DGGLTVSTVFEPMAPSAETNAAPLAPLTGLPAGFDADTSAFTRCAPGSTVTAPSSGLPGLVLGAGDSTKRKAPLAFWPSSTVAVLPCTGTRSTKPAPAGAFG